MARLGLVCLEAYPLFVPRSGGPFGGSGVRAWLFARQLARSTAHEVRMMVGDYGQGASETVDGVKLLRHGGYRMAGPAARPPSILRRAAGLARRMLQPGVDAGGVRLARARLEPFRVLEADVLCTFGASELSAEAVAYARQSGIPAVFIAGSDYDFCEDHARGADMRNAYGADCRLCRYGIVAADAIVVQNDAQRRALQERFGRNGVKIANPVELQAAVRESGAGAAHEVLWIGKSDTTKQPHVVLELARRLPAARFLMVMNRSSVQIFDSIVASVPANVTIVESLPFHEADALFARAAVLLNTSVFEGFPNTFLQAGKHGVPVLSLAVDPDGVLAARQGGLVAGGSVPRLGEALERVLGDAELRRALGGNLKRYVEEAHDAGMCAAALERVLSGTLHG